MFVLSLTCCLLSFDGHSSWVLGYGFWVLWCSVGVGVRVLRFLVISYSGWVLWFVASPNLVSDLM